MAKYRATYAVITTYSVEFEVDPAAASDGYQPVPEEDVPLGLTAKAVALDETLRAEAYDTDHVNRVFFDRFAAFDLKDAVPYAVEGPVNLVIEAE